ncbi:MAG: glyoxalase/bleomycin resistance/extradiol dioxygenase family protein [Gemmatimonadales bacterium]|nr:MAG: glyoxalase/bleomycin resistance/extradiol dioxygenase family protein [Gemmatimonadales bacterium]
MRAGRIFETALYGSDLDAMQQFYQRVLGLELASRFGDRGVALRCGRGVLLLFNPDTTELPGRDVPAHGSRGAGHMAFAVPGSELDAWRGHLSDCHVPVENEVEWPEGGWSIYFRDPAGNSVELAPPTLWGFGAAGMEFIEETDA